MTLPWSKVPLGELVIRSDETITLQPDAEYRELTVKLWGKGVVLRQVLTGAQVAAPQRYVARTGQFVLSRIDARNGALGIVPPELGGAIVSTDFPVFHVIRERIEPAFLGWVCRTKDFVAECRRASEGTTNRVRIQEAKLLATRIPLPPLAEQRRLVARIEEMAASIEASRDLRRGAQDEANALVGRTITSVLDRAPWPRLPLGEVLSESPRNGLSPKPEAGSGGRPMLRISAVSSSPTRVVNLGSVKNVEVSDLEAKPFVLVHDDVFIVRYNADINRLARAAIHKSIGDCDTVYPDKLIRLRPDRSKMLPDFLVFALATQSVREQVEKLGKTTAGNIGISGTNVKSLIVPVPSLGEQRRIVAELDELQVQVDAVTRLQTEAGAQLDALLPAVLDCAFRGEL
jgi:type I restriction enzyme S subunit